MKTLLKNGTLINVFTGELEHTSVLMENDRIIGVDAYADSEADKVEDVRGKYICPGFIDGHIHIESTMLQPAELARACLAHGTTAIIADPHEITNVSGLSGIFFMLESSEGIPLTVYMMISSCVPATAFDESGACLTAADILPFYSHERILGLGEVMNYPAVLAGDPEILKKISDARKAGKIVNGHAPLLTGKDLDRYIAAGIYDDHECTNWKEGMERIGKGQWVMIRQGTAAKNLDDLMPLFEEPYCRRCLLVTDDKHPADLLISGHIDAIIRRSVENGKAPMTGIRMATLQTAQCFGLKETGAIAPGYLADLLVLDDLNSVKVRDVYHHGEKVVDRGIVKPFDRPFIRPDVWKAVRNSFYLDPVNESSFYIVPEGQKCRVIKLAPHQLITQEWITDIDFSAGNGVDLQRDILKLAVIERHMNSGHVGRGFISGLGLKRGAIASSVSHDSHNLIAVGTNDRDMAIAANRVRELGGGLVAAESGRVLAEMALPIAGLMGKKSAREMADQNEAVRLCAHSLGVPVDIEPFMAMAFVSLPVIPSIKMTTRGLVDVNRQEVLGLFVH